MNRYEQYFKSVVKESSAKRYENHLLAQIREHAFKEPEREYRFHRDRKWRFDFAYPAIRLAIEVEGGIWSGGRHTRGSGFEADCEKYNEAAAAGWRVIRFTPGMIMKLKAIEFLERIFANG